MKIRRICLDQELLWVMDDVIGGLYSINRRTFETKCVVDFLKLFPNGKFEIQSLINWNDDYIIMIPLEINRNWICYNKITGEIEYRKVVEQKCQERLIVVAQDRNQIYFFPLLIHQPAIIVELNNLRCAQIIENWSERLPGDCSETVWTGTYNGQYVFYPKKNTQVLIRIDCRTRKLNQVKVDIPGNLIDVNYAFGELWVLPASGNRLYQIDENGQIVNTVQLSGDNVTDLMPDFARIVVQKRYLFLLPCYRKGIYVYDKWEGKTHIIPKESQVLHKENKTIHLRYWEYCITDDKICFLPYLDQCIEIDLNTLAYKKKELCYPKIWSDKDKICKRIQSNISKLDFIIHEIYGCNLEIFLEYIQLNIITEKILKDEYKGKKIWNML